MACISSEERKSTVRFSAKVQGSYSDLEHVTGSMLNLNMDEHGKEMVVPLRFMLKWKNFGTGNGELSNLLYFYDRKAWDEAF